VKKELLDLMGKRDEAYAAAKERLSAQDYDGVLEEIARIEESLLHDKITQLRNEAIDKRDRLKSLRPAISEGVKTKQLNGLLKKVEEGLLLKYEDTELLNLRTQLHERDRKLKETRDAVYRKGQRLYQLQDYEGCLSEIGQIDPSMLTREIEKLREDAAGRCDRLKSLRAAISEGVKTKQLHGLLKKVDECLSLKSGDAELEKLRGQLQAREKKVTVKVTAGLTKARSLRQACRFESALKLLEKMPEDLGTLSSEINDLNHNCRQLAEFHFAATHAVKAASSLEMPVALITRYESDISGYQNALTAESLEDPKFLSVCDAAVLKLSKLRGANEQQRKIRLAIAGAVGVLQKYAGFHGRASRSEYISIISIWIFVLFCFALFPLLLPVFLIWSYAAVSVSVRRLHDINKSGWWISWIPLFFILSIFEGAFDLTDKVGVLVCMFVILSGISLGMVLMYKPSTQDAHQSGIHKVAKSENVPVTADATVHPDYMVIFEEDGSEAKP
jgi:uncharacterized membrane protein YhaH (DUF805 family)